MRTTLCLRRCRSSRESTLISVSKSELVARTFAPMVRAICFTVLLIALSGVVAAQRVNLSDSLRRVLRQPVTPVLKLDSRYSFVTGRSVDIWGIKAGVSFGKRLNLGAMYSWLNTPISQNVTAQDNIVSARLRLRYGGLFAEYTFYRKGPWEAMIPIQMGFGRSFLEDPEGVRYYERPVLFYEPAMVVDYKIYNLVALGGGFGYRLLLLRNPDIDQQLTAPIYMLRARILLENLRGRAQSKRKEVQTGLS